MPYIIDINKRRRKKLLEGLVAILERYEFILLLEYDEVWWRWVSFNYNNIDYKMWIYKVEEKWLTKYGMLRLGKRVEWWVCEQGEYRVFMPMTEEAVTKFFKKQMFRLHNPDKLHFVPRKKKGDDVYRAK